jgi:hypothetical protein
VTAEEMPGGMKCSASGCWTTPGVNSLPCLAGLELRLHAFPDFFFGRSGMSTLQILIYVNKSNFAELERRNLRVILAPWSEQDSARQGRLQFHYTRKTRSER